MPAEISHFTVDADAVEPYGKTGTLLFETKSQKTDTEK
jgi:hypothetical protein